MSHSSNPCRTTTPDLSSVDPANLRTLDTYKADAIPDSQAIQESCLRNSGSFNFFNNRSSIPTPPSEEFSEAYLNYDAESEALLPAVTDEEPPVVAVIGVGYVGINLVTSFAPHYNVIAFDVSSKRLQEIQPILKSYSSVSTTTNPKELAQATHFLVCVPTTLLPDQRIDTSFLETAVYTIGLYARRNAIIVVESSVAVGMTRRLLSDLMRLRGFKGGMSPERVDPGRVTPVLQAIPKIISGFDDISPGSLASIAKLYSRVFEKVVPVSRPEVAEMTKLYENCQRMICIAYANEMADACISHDIDPFEVCKAAATKPFGYMNYSPGLGVGGHCIPVNPYYLLSNCNFPLLQTATENMWNRPSKVGDMFMEDLLNKSPLSPWQQGTDSSSCSSSPRQLRPRILVVGAAFKKGQSLLSHSPSVGLMRHLLQHWEAHVTFVDSFVSEEALNYIPKLDEKTQWNKETLEASFDLIVVALKQDGLDLGILDELEGVMVKWCC